MYQAAVFKLTNVQSPGATKDVSNLLGMQATVIADMSAGDTANMSFQISNSTKVVDIHGIS